MTWSSTLDPTTLAGLLGEAFESAAVAVVITIDRGGHHERVYVNQATAALSGYSRDELLASATLGLSPELLELCSARFAGHPVPSTIETWIPARDGRQVPVVVSCASTTLSGQPATVAFIQDRTAAHAAQRALAASEERFRVLAEAAPDTIVVVAEGRMVYANPNAVRALGFPTLDELLARPLSQLVVPEDVPEMFDRIRGAMAGKRYPPREYRGRRKDGSVLVMEISSVASVWEGRPAVVAFGRDVTERKALLQAALEGDRLAAVGTLAAGVAHEVNNPLTSAMLNLEMLRARGAPPADARLLDRVHEGLERVRRIVQDLLSFSRPSPDIVEEVDVERAVESSVRLARAGAGGDARIETAVGGLPSVRTNGARLGQVLLNVVLNAIQAVEDRPEGLVRVTGVARAGTLRIEVIDNGPGIPPEIFSRIFEPFFSTKPPGRGTGLGLCVSRTIVSALGGDIRLASEVGIGTVVTIELPLGQAAEQPARPRVLVLDDDAELAEVIAGLLSDFEAEPCTDPIAGLERLQAERWEAVVCDVRMPRLSGPALLLQLAERRPELARRFVFITGGVTEAVDDAVLRRFGLPVLRKPFEAKQLAGILADVVRRG